MTAKTKESSTPKTRAVTRTVRIDVPVADVWKALTDASELERWFPPRARVKPGPGGTIEMTWSEDFDTAEIEIWEPGKHLRTRGTEGSWIGIVTDYFLTGDRGTTTLRVVTSGFDEDADWDEFVGAFGRGWDFELGGLKHYLERHHGLERVVARASIPYTISHVQAWDRFWQSIDGGALAGKSPGEQFELTIGGRDIRGRVLLLQPPYQFVGLVKNWNDALFRVELFGKDDRNRIQVWMSTYGVATDDVSHLESSWQAMAHDLRIQ